MLPVCPESPVNQMQTSQPETFVAITTGRNGLSIVVEIKARLGSRVEHTITILNGSDNI